MDFRELNCKIARPDALAAQRAKAHWDAIAKPLNGLGAFEDMVVKIAALTGDEHVVLSPRVVAVLCADNGMVCEGVTQTDASVTAQMAEQILRGRSSVCLMAASAGADVVPVDMGMLHHVSGVSGCHIADGTQNIAVGPAMTQAEAIRAISAGIALAQDFHARGYRLIATGEMGIGNTTTASALAAVLLDMPIDSVVGRGAGLSDAGLARKQAVIRRAIAVNAPDPSDPLDVLAKLGGFDIAGMVGLFLGAALCRVPILIDGLISSIAALLAARLCPNAVCAMLASHCSAEPAAQRILRELSLHAVLDAALKLGEGTGAVCMMPLLDLALSVYHGSAGFSDVGVAQYTVQEGDRR